MLQALNKAGAEDRAGVKRLSATRRRLAWNQIADQQMLPVVPWSRNIAFTCSDSD